MTNAAATDLLKPLLNFSSLDDWTALDACEGTVIFGAPGSGKTTTTSKQIAHSFLTSGWGGLVLCAKPDETQTWKSYARETGREQDLIIFNAASGHTFDPIFYEWNREGPGAADIENIVELFSTLLAIGKAPVGMSAERYFELAAEYLMRVAIVLLAQARVPLSIASLTDLIESLPTRPGESDTESWQRTSKCAAWIRAITERFDTLTPEQWSDLDIASRFALETWPQMDERPRSSIQMTFTGMSNRFVFQPYKRLLCSGKCTFLPEQTTLQGKIVVCDFSYLQFGETGKLINCLLKYVFQRAWLRRDVTKDPACAFLWQDEFQYFLLPRGKDNAFQQTCRSARIANVCITQSLSNISEALDEQNPGSKSKSFLGNLMLKVFHQNNDTATNSYAADLIGKEYRDLSGSSVGREVSMSRNQHLLHKVEPDEFTRLLKPGPRTPVAEAIVYAGGKAFEITRTDECPQGQSFLRTGFSR